MKTLTLTSTAQHEFLQQLSFNLNVPLQNNRLNLPESIGTGFIKNISLDNECCIRYYHVLLKEDILYKWFADTKSEDPVFKLVFSLSPETNTAQQSIYNRNIECKAASSAVLYSTDFSRAAVVPQSRWINRVVIVFTRKWLETNFTQAYEQVSGLLDMLAARHQPALITEILNEQQQLLVNELAAEMSRARFSLLHAKAKSYTAIERFLDRLVKRSLENNTIPVSLTHPRIAEVENCIKEYFDKQIPCIDELANRFCMSSASLKRHFKMSYGKSIYQYYLEKKMALGKEMICDLHKSVTEVAYTLGYNKINSFSKVFKKHYGILPKEAGNRRSIA